MDVFSLRAQESYARKKHPVSHNALVRGGGGGGGLQLLLLALNGCDYLISLVLDFEQARFGLYKEFYPLSFSHLFILV